MTGDEHDEFPEEPIPIPIDGRLDLHLFRPSDVKALLGEYLPACQAKGILDVQIIHGKGTGALRRTVHALLPRMPQVLAFGTPDETLGGWGVTWVKLRPTSTGE